MLVFLICNDDDDNDDNVRAISKDIKTNDEIDMIVNERNQKRTRRRSHAPNDDLRHE